MRRAIQCAPAQASITTVLRGVLPSNLNRSWREHFAKHHPAGRVLPMQMEAVFAQIDANQRDGAHERSPKEHPHSAYRFVGIGLTISLAPSEMERGFL